MRSPFSINKLAVSDTQSSSYLEWSWDRGYGVDDKWEIIKEVKEIIDVALNRVEIVRRRLPFRKITNTTNFQSAC